MPKPAESDFFVVRMDCSGPAQPFVPMSALPFTLWAVKDASGYNAKKYSPADHTG